MPSIDYLPFPGENGGISIVDEDGKLDRRRRKSRTTRPARALAFKVINDQFGTLTFVRVYSGVIKKGDTLLNVTRGKKERIGRIVEVQAERHEGHRRGARRRHLRVRLDEGNGDRRLAVVSGHIRRCSSACVSRIPSSASSVEPKTRGDVDKMSTALYKMVKADPSLRLEVDQETGQTVLRGMGELHLEVTIDRMRTELGVEAEHGPARA